MISVFAQMTRTVSVLLFVTTTLGYNGDMGQSQQFETTTAVNDMDNSVYSGNETPAPRLQFPEHMPTTGCFHPVPAPEEDGIKSNNIDTFPRDHPASDPIPPQFNTFVPPTPYRPVSPGFAPQSFENRNYYPFSHPVMPFNPVAPPPMSFSPYQRLAFPNQVNSARPIVIVKLLQPIILPVAKPMFPEGGERNPDEVDSERFTGPSFPRGHGFHRFGGRRFGAEKYRSVEQPERPLPYRQRTFGPYKVAGEENIHVTVKLH